MIVKSIKTRILHPPQDNLLEAIKESLDKVDIVEKSVFVVTSKVVSIWQGRCVKQEYYPDKDELIKQEADLYLDRSDVPGDHQVMITIKDQIMSLSSGIDLSNANGFYILWPQNTYQAATDIYSFIKTTYNLNELAVIISDSRSTPLRRGATGMALAFHGLDPLDDVRGQADLFGREMHVEVVNLVDALASSAVLEMGEVSQQSPLAIITDCNFIKFNQNYTPHEDLTLEVDLAEDIYYPISAKANWKKGGGGLNS